MNEKTMKNAEKQRKQPIKPRTQVRKLIKPKENLRKPPKKQKYCQKSTINIRKSLEIQQEKVKNQ